MSGCAGQASTGDELLAEDPTAEASLPDGTRQADWDAESVDDETRSTHLWIVNRAVGLLGQRADLPQAAGVAALLGAADCRPRWHQGLADADFKAAYNGGRWDVPVGGSSTALVLAGATWESHFYDPDSGLNYKGHSSPTGYDQGLQHLANARAKLAANDRAGGCYELGLSLHYMTDLTQPMHASNYTATNWPVKLHSNVEVYAMAQQARWAVSTWSGPTAGDATAQLLAAARAAKPRWPVLRAAIAAAYGARCGNFNSYWTDHTDCWTGDAAVDAQLAIELAASQNATASYLYAANLR
ncbi:MAG: Broad-substrate range phospholipase [Myxococcales bacterium]|nr:Broad-substrate range phospholipase [Myxococcales bacterium]